MGDVKCKARVESACRLLSSNPMHDVLVAVMYIACGHQVVGAGQQGEASLADEIVDVAIVGCGPVGGLLANLLGQAGLGVVVLERDADIYPLPRAMHFDGEIMRMLPGRRAGRCRGGHRAAVDEGHAFRQCRRRDAADPRAATDGPGPHGWVNNRYGTSRSSSDPAAGTCAVRQRRGAARARGDGARQPQADGVRLEVRERGHGRGATTLLARYVVGCDGARSLVRTAIGVRRRRPRVASALAGRRSVAIPTGHVRRAARAHRAVLRSRAPDDRPSTSPAAGGAGRSC